MRGENKNERETEEAGDTLRGHSSLFEQIALRSETEAPHQPAPSLKCFGLLEVCDN